MDHFSRSDRSDRKMTVPFDHSDSILVPVAASVYRCSFCDVTVPSLENLLSHDCQAITGVFICCFCRKKNHPSKKSVCVRVSTVTIPTKTNHSQKFRTTWLPTRPHACADNTTRRSKWQQNI